MHEKIVLSGCTLRLIGYNDTPFIQSLFTISDIRKYYVIRNDHLQNINLFVDSMVQGCRRGSELDYIIKDNNNNDVGFITAELKRDELKGNVVWNVGYAIHPNYRALGYATTALDGLCDYLFKKFLTTEAMLDISTDNNASEKVAQKCGFSKPDDGGLNIACLDLEHEDVGMRFRWYKATTNKRLVLCNKAIKAFQNKNYTEALTFFKQALNEDYSPEGPYPDALIYSNMGMAYSRLHMYEEDFRCLKKAQSMGLNNPTIDKELLWLRNNIGLY